jgi:hypothetical protein
LKNSCDTPLLTQIGHQNADFGHFWSDSGPSMGLAAAFSTGWTRFETAQKAIQKSMTRSRR